MHQNEFLPEETSSLRSVFDGRREPYVYHEIRGIADLVRLCFERWRLLILPAAIVTIATGLIAQFGLTKWYQATAMLSPASESPFDTHMPSLEGGSLDLSAGVGAALGLSNENQGTANEFLQVLQSPQFALEVIRQRQLLNHFVGSHKRWLPFGRPSVPLTYESLASSRLLQWQVYLDFKGRFTSTYDADSGVLKLTFVDKSPAAAEAVLGNIIGDFRNTLRQWQLHDAGTAAKALTEEAAKTADDTLRAELYVLAASQVQRQELARVTSNFAFVVLQYPSSPFKKYSPSPILDSILVGMLTFALFLGYVWLSPAFGQIRTPEFGDEIEPRRVPRRVDRAAVALQANAKS
jgi:Chain length determinant protein